MLTTNKLSCFPLLLSPLIIKAQNLLSRGDLSYVNEMENCGVVFKKIIAPKMCSLSSKHGCNMVRFRLLEIRPLGTMGLTSVKDTRILMMYQRYKKGKRCSHESASDFHFSDSWADRLNNWFQVVGFRWGVIMPCRFFA